MKYPYRVGGGGAGGGRRIPALLTLPAGLTSFTRELRSLTSFTRELRSLTSFVRELRSLTSFVRELQILMRFAIEPGNLTSFTRTLGHLAGFITSPESSDELEPLERLENLTNLGRNPEGLTSSASLTRWPHEPCLRPGTPLELHGPRRRELPPTSLEKL